MTGRELIAWIQENNAEDAIIITQYRDAGGNYLGGEYIDFPIMACYKGTGVAYDKSVNIDYYTKKKNCIVF